MRQNTAVNSSPSSAGRRCAPVACSQAPLLITLVTHLPCPADRADFAAEQWGEPGSCDHAWQEWLPGDECVLKHLLSALLNNKGLALPHLGSKMVKKAAGVSLSSCAPQTAAGDGDTHHAAAAGWRFLGLWDAIIIQLRFRLQHISLAWWALCPPATISSNDAHETGSNNSTRIKRKYETEAVWWNGNYSPIIEVQQVCLFGVVAQDRKGIIRDLPLMSQICAGCLSAGSPVPRRRRHRRCAATAAAYLRSWQTGSSLRTARPLWVAVPEREGGSMEGQYTSEPAQWNHR